MSDEAGQRRWPAWVYGVGDDPDPRFSLANERTFLAWIRTGLAFVTAGLGISALAHFAPPPVPGSSRPRWCCSVAACCAGSPA
ncbi:MAG: DUF202 domain-containing protein [Micropruina glycogenica]